MNGDRDRERVEEREEACLVEPSPGRRKALLTLGALAVVTVQPACATGGGALSAGSCAALPQSGRRITHMIGSNGWPGTPDDLCFWKDMGITWGRGPVGPGQPASPNDAMVVDKTGNAFDADLPSVILRNNRNGIASLLLLAYTPKWNATIPGDSKSAPRDVHYWERYVEAAVKKYSAPPYNVRHFQVWNEAAGKLSGGSPQATFWHGPNFSSERGRSQPYERAMQDYVERIHVPAARIIRNYHAYVVYGGWPDQGGLGTFSKWLEYESPTLNTRMLDLVDYIDTHYLKVNELSTLYERYVANGPARGIWQTEIGDEYMKDPHYLPSYFFNFAVWALDRNWDDPNKYVSMVYHWDGFEPFRLTHRGSPQQPQRTYNVSGTSLVVLRKTVPGVLSRFDGTLAFGQDAEGNALYSDSSLIVKVRADGGPRTLDIKGFARTGGKPRATFVDAVTGENVSGDGVAVNWKGDALSIRFDVPGQTNGGNPKHPSYLGYLVISRGG
jgi:hypothetical protein